MTPHTETEKLVYSELTKLLSQVSQPVEISNGVWFISGSGNFSSIRNTYTEANNVRLNFIRAHLSAKLGIPGQIPELKKNRGPWQLYRKAVEILEAQK